MTDLRRRAASTRRPKPHRPAVPVLAVPVLAVLVLAGCGNAGDDDGAAGATPEETGSITDPAGPDDLGVGGATLAGATLQDVDGTEVGTVTFRESGDTIEVTVAVGGLEPGFHGLHVHAVGLCEPESSPPDDPDSVGAFLSAGGHLGVGDSDHGDHTGDLPSLYVAENGEGQLITVTDRLTADELLDEDGSAVIVHADPDNFAHIPERYAPQGPDEQTLGTGDAGDRLACGVVN